MQKIERKLDYFFIFKYKAYKNGDGLMTSIFLNELYADIYIQQNQDDPEKLSVKDEHGNSLAHMHPSLATELSMLGVDVNSENNNGDTPLMHCARKGMIIDELVELTSRENLKRIYRDGETILTAYLKSKRTYPEVIEVLCERGADVNKKNAQGKTPLQISLERNEKLRKAIKSGELKNLSEAKKNYSKFDTTYILLEYGADVKNVLVEGLTVLSYKILNAEYGDLEKIKRLIEKPECDLLFGTDKRGNTPLHNIMFCQEIVGDLLVADIIKNVDIDAPNNKGETALHLAIQEKKSPKFVKMLIENKANINIKNNNGKTPMDLAQESGIREYIELLEARIKERICASTSIKKMVKQSRLEGKKNTRT